MNKLSYKDLVLNTLLDSIKREGRYTIDITDIWEYEKIITAICHASKMDIVVGSVYDSESFKHQLENIAFRYELNGKDTFTLLPWVSIDELEWEVEDTIFSKEDMELVGEVTKANLNDKRSKAETYVLNKTTDHIYYHLYNKGLENIRDLDIKKTKVKYKLSKIEDRLNLVK